MSEYIQPDFSIRVTFGDEEQIVNRVYDHVHLFRPLGHGIIKIMTSEGFQQWHLPIDQAETVAEGAGITPIERPEISQKEYDAYLRYQEKTMDDDWLDGDAEHPLG